MKREPELSWLMRCIADIKLPQAARFARAGLHSAALAALDEMDPESVAAQLLRGRIYAQMGRVEESRSVFERLLQRDASNAEAAAGLTALSAISQHGPANQAALWRASAIGLSLAIAILITSLPMRTRPTSADAAAQPRNQGLLAQLAEQVFDLELAVRELGSRSDSEGEDLEIRQGDLLALARVDGLLTSHPVYRGVDCDALLRRDGRLRLSCSGLVTTTWILGSLDRDLARLAGGAEVLTDSIEVSNRLVVRVGDTLAHIALFAYGDARRWPDIYRANSSTLTDPDVLTPGVELVLPDLD